MAGSSIASPLVRDYARANDRVQSFFGRVQSLAGSIVSTSSRWPRKACARHSPLRSPVSRVSVVPRY